MYNKYTVTINVSKSSKFNSANRYLEHEKLIEFKLFNVLGNEVIQSKQTSIDVANLPNGVYFVQVKTNEGISTQKVIVQC